MRILISTGIYPPQIGGPSEYSKNLKMALKNEGNSVSVATFSIENYLPTGLRHLYFLIKILPKVLFADLVIVMDTFSVGLPTIFASKIFGKKSIIRTGGDFLWEGYVERTGKKVLLRNFYTEEMSNLSAKERMILKLTRWTLNSSSRVVFSTLWQRDIFIKAYGLDKSKTEIIENYYGEKEGNLGFESKLFLASGRKLVLKNLPKLEKIFSVLKGQGEDIELFTKNVSYAEFMEKMKTCYAVVAVSLSEISPNIILDAIRNNKPFICTKEVGIFDRIKDVGIFVDPLNEDEIKNAILQLLNPEKYEMAKEKVKSFTFTHNWSQIAKEFLGVYNKIK